MNAILSHLKTVFDDQKSQDQKVTVNADSLGKDGEHILTCLKQALSLESLVIGGASLSIEPDGDNLLLVSGTAEQAIMGVEQGLITCSFKVVNSVLELQTLIQPVASQNWTFFTSFPSFMVDVTIDKEPYFIFTSIDASTQQIWWVDVGEKKEESFTSLKQGLNFSAALNTENGFASFFAVYASGIANPLKVSGPVTTQPTGEFEFSLYVPVPDKSIGLPGIAAIDFKDSHFELWAHGIPASPTASFAFRVCSNVTFKVDTHDFTLPLALQFPTGISGWQIQLLGGSSFSSKNVLDIIKTFTGQDLNNTILKDFSVVFEIQSFVIELDNDFKNFQQLSLGLICKNNEGSAPWEIFEGFSLDSISFSMQYVSASQETSGQITGVCTLGEEPETLKLVCVIPFSKDMGSLWTFNATGGMPLSSLNPLKKLINTEDLLNFLPPTLKDGLGKLQLNTIGFAVDPKNKKLAAAAIGINMAAPWKIVPGQLEFLGLSLYVSATSPTKSPQFTVNILGDMLIADSIRLHAEVNKSPGVDWNFYLAANQVPLPSIKDLDKLFGDRGLSDYLPTAIANYSFTVSDFNLNINLTSLDIKSLGFTITSNQSWDISEKFKLNNLTVSMAADNVADTFSSGIYGIFTFMGTSFTANATYDKAQGYLFSCSTNPGQSIAILKVFEEMNASLEELKNLPDFIRNLTINQLSVDYTVPKGENVTNDLRFVCTVETSINGAKTTLYVDVSRSADQKLSIDCIIRVYLGADQELEFEFKYDKDKEHQQLIATCEKKDGITLQLSDLIDQVYPDASVPDFSITLKDAFIAYLKSSPVGQEKENNDPNPAKLVFGLDLSTDFSLSGLPLVGQVVPPELNIRIESIRLLVLSKELLQKEAKQINEALAVTGIAPLTGNVVGGETPTENSIILNKGLCFGADARIGSYSASSILPSAPPKKPTQENNKEYAPFMTSPPVSWIPINKVLGPVTIDKIGFSCELPKKKEEGTVGEIGIDLQGSFKVASLSLTLDRLGLKLKVPDPSNPSFQIPSFHLGGLTMEYKTPQLEIGGGFISIPGEHSSFIGQFKVKAGKYGLQAYGGFSNELDNPSLFLFLHLDAPIGGPPFFFIVGLSGGFGVNRAFRLPDYTELSNYPLLPSNSTIPTPAQMTGNAQDKMSKMTNSLAHLAEYIYPEEGTYWFAIGLDVTSFEMIKVSAILSIEFGHGLQIGLIGRATMTMPVGAVKPIAYVQIDFLVSFSPDDGLLAVIGKINPASYVFDGLVQISGGFAFYTWLSGENEGNFVMTIGGYNSHYSKPIIYPIVPRVQLRYGISQLNVIGQCYFALLPNMMMAGISMDATWSTGPIQAWFSAGMDFVLNWKPFHYQATGYVHIGASFTVDIGFVTIGITIHVGVDLEIWGPAFGGRATVDLDIISFTISFGESPQGKQYVDWTEFKALLPNLNNGIHTPHYFTKTENSENPPLVNITVSEGLQKIYEPGNSENLDWLIDPNHFQLTTQSIAPCTNVTFNNVKNLNEFKDTDYVDPNNLAKSIKEKKDAGPPYFAYSIPEKPEDKWTANKYGIPAMINPANPASKENLGDIKSVHHVELTSSESGLEVNSVIIELVTKQVPKSLWGLEQIGNNIPKEEALIGNALTELNIIPGLYFPKRTIFIAYYYLVFSTNNLFLEQETEPEIKAPDFIDPARIYEDMNSGMLFTETAPARNKIVSLLNSDGFQHLNLKGDTMNTAMYKDNPILCYMSSIN